MAGRIDWRVSVTPIQTQTGNDDASNVETLAVDVGGSLGGGNSSDSWTGTSDEDVTGFASGKCTTHLSANGGTIDTPALCDGVWVKNIGYVYDAAASDKKGTTATNADSYVTITIGEKVVAKLGAGEGMYFPEPVSGESDFITLADVGTDDAAVEYAIFLHTNS